MAAATKGERMFIQVIEGKCRDEAALERQIEIWQRDLQPGAAGYLGSTGGVTTTGDCIMVVRFESEELARRNSDRPEQAAWWEQTQQCFDGPIMFHDTTDVQVMDHGLGDDVGFVQVMEGHCTDLDVAHRLEEEADEPLAQYRPDLKGTITAYYGDNEFCSVAYFTNETEARMRESQEMPPELAQEFAQYESVMKVDRYLDLDHPWLASAR